MTAYDACEHPDFNMADNGEWTLLDSDGVDDAIIPEDDAILLPDSSATDISDHPAQGGISEEAPDIFTPDMDDEADDNSVFAADMEPEEAPDTFTPDMDDEAGDNSVFAADMEPEEVSDSDMADIDDADVFADESNILELGENDGAENDTADGAEEESMMEDLLLEPMESGLGGGLSACNYKCIMSYCYPVNIAKGIGTNNPHRPNSSVGHS